MTRATILMAVLGLGSMIASATAAPIVIGNGDTGFATMNQVYGPPAWMHGNTGDGYISWSFSGLAAGDYEVYTTWVTKIWWDTRNTAAPFAVYDGTLDAKGWPDWTITPSASATYRGTTLVDENPAAAGIDYASRSWLGLGTFTCNSGTLSVLLTNPASTGQADVIVGDSVMIQAVPEPASLALVGTAGLMMLRRRRA